MRPNTPIATPGTVPQVQPLGAVNGMLMQTTGRMSLIPHRSMLKRAEKLNYIEAVHCMGKTKARTPAAVASGAISRYDDFVVTHILLTQYTHGNVFFVNP